MVVRCLRSQQEVCGPAGEEKGRWLGRGGCLDEQRVSVVLEEVGSDKTEPGLEVAVGGRRGEGIRGAQGTVRGGSRAAWIAGVGVGGPWGTRVPTRFPLDSELHRIGVSGGAALRPATGAAGAWLPLGGAGGAPRPAGGAAGPAAEPGHPRRGGHTAGAAAGAGHTAAR